MKASQFVLSGCVIALAVAPVASAAAPECAVAKPDAASYTWNFRQEADNIFAGIRSDAARAKSDAARLQRVVSGPDAVSWVSDSGELERIRAKVNDMGRDLCRLESIRSAVAPWQQKTIDQVDFDLKLLADNTQDAITFGNTHRRSLWVPGFGRTVDNMYTEARGLAQCVGNAVKYAHVERQYRVLRKDVNGRSSS